MRKKAEATDEIIIGYIREKYGAEPEYLWARTPDCAAFRHSDNRKWFALLMTVKADRLMPGREGNVRILNIKCDQLMSGSLRQLDGYFPAYHMNKESWITILLDGTVPAEDIFSAVDMSYSLTAAAAARSTAAGGRTWVIPAKPDVYDVDRDFRENGEILWHQDRKISTGETVYIYMGAPVSAILYRTTATETDIPELSGGKAAGRKLMKLRLEKRYEMGLITLERLRKHGVVSVRCARTLPDTLIEEIKLLEK